MTLTVRHLAVATGLAIAAITAPAGAQTAPVNVCSEQNTGEEETESSYCQGGEAAIPDQEGQGNGNFSGGGNREFSGQGNEQGNENFNDQLSEQPQP
jgi:putative hemolysin